LLAARTPNLSKKKIKKMSLELSQKLFRILGGAKGIITLQFMISISFKYVNLSPGAQESLEEKVSLKPCDTYDLSKIQTPSDCITVANGTESLGHIEDCIHIWIKQIEQVLAESEQMRREADDIGPRAELDHWKKRMSRFNYLLDQIKGQEVKAVLGVMQAAKSKVLKVGVNRTCADLGGAGGVHPLPAEGALFCRMVQLSNQNFPQKRHSLHLLCGPFFIGCTPPPPPVPEILDPPLIGEQL
jgi:hypothetical protein